MNKTIRIKRKSKKQEERTAKQLGGRTQIASGAINCSTMKADVRTDKYLVENKFTDAEVYSLSISTWDKINKEASRDGARIPLLQLDLQNDSFMILYDKDCNVPRTSKARMLDIKQSKNISLKLMNEAKENDETLNFKYTDKKTRKVKVLRIVTLQDFLNYEGSK